MKKKKDPRLTTYGIIKKGVMTKYGIVQSYRVGMYIIETDERGSTYEFEHAELFPLPKYRGVIKYKRIKK